MIDKTKSAGGCETTTADTKHDTGIISFRARCKTFIVWLALWGVLPVSIAEWLIRVGGLRHE